MANLTRHRDRALARRSRKSGESLTEYLAFVLAGEVYAVPIREVREILKVPPVTPVPRASAHVLGIVSVRGQLVTVIDLRRRLRIPVTPVTPRARILLTTSADDEVVGLYVDEVLQVHRLSESEIELAANVLGGQLADYIVGVGRPPGSLLVLIDLAPVIARST